MLFDVWLVSRATAGLLDAALAPTGLSADEFGVYSALTSADSLTPTELARWMSAPPTTVSSYVRRLTPGAISSGSATPATAAPTSCASPRRAGPRTPPPAGGFLPALEAVVAALGADEPGVRRALAVLRRSLEQATSR